MKRLILTIAALMIAASAGAEHVYKGLAEDNPDLRGHGPEQPMTASESATTAETPIYHGLAEDNPDLVGQRADTGPSGEKPDIYEGIEPNPDTSF
jgi:hypothetical protein